MYIYIYSHNFLTFNRLSIMKKSLNLFFLLLVSFLTLGISSCSDSDEPETQDIVGTWKISEVSTNDGQSYIAWPFETTSATFKSDGTYYGRGYFGYGSGTWKQKGKTVTTYVDGDVYLVYTIINMSSSTCTLKMSQPGSTATIYIKCIKG